MAVAGQERADLYIRRMFFSTHYVVRQFTFALILGHMPHEVGKNQAAVDRHL